MLGSDNIDYVMLPSVDIMSRVCTIDEMLVQEFKRAFPSIDAPRAYGGSRQSRLIYTTMPTYNPTSKGTKISGFNCNPTPNGSKILNDCNAVKAGSNRSNGRQRAKNRKRERTY
jgi:hypothetical protein